MMAVPSRAHRIRMVLLDQHVLIRDALRTLLDVQPQFAVVGEGVPGPDAVALVAQHQPDIILLNLLLQPHALDLIPPLLAAADHARALVVLEAQHDEGARQALCLGATGVVRIDQAPAVLCDAIVKVYAGEVWADRRLLTQVLTDLSPAGLNGEAEPDRVKLRRLTARQREVIALVAAGLRNQEVAQQLSVTEATVRHHLTSIFRKLAVRDRTELIAYAYRHGLVTPPVQLVVGGLGQAVNPIV